MWSSDVELFRSYFSLLGFTWPPPAIYRKNNWVCERDKWQVRSHLKPAKGVGWQKLIRIHCPLSNCKLFMIPRSPPPFFNFFFLQWWPEQGLHGILFYYVVPKFTAYGFKRFNNKSIFQSQKKIDLVEIVSLNVMDEAVLRSPEWVSAGGPPAARSSCPPGPRSGRSLLHVTIFLE